MKSLPLLISPRASRQIEEIVEWYERQREGLGQSFYAELSRTFQTISLMPEAFQRVRGQTRRVVTRRFPYIVYYRIAKGRVEVLRVLHGARQENG